jgi:hypothetical protein
MAGTLTVAEILTDVLDAFKTRLPSLNLPATGYNANAQAGRDLLVDVPITMDTWSDVQIKFGHGDVVTDRSKNYTKTISNAGYALSKAVVDNALSKIVAASFSEKTTAAYANTSKDTLDAVTLAMNAKKAGSPRYMICSSQFFNKLEEDARIASGDYHGQRRGADPFGKLLGVSGFAEIHEYPDFPTAGNLSAFGFDSRAIAVATRLPMDSVELARELGVPVGIKTETVQDAETGLALSGFGQFDNNTHDLVMSITIMHGAVAGSQAAGVAGTKLDYAGHRVITA